MQEPDLGFGVEISAGWLLPDIELGSVSAANGTWVMDYAISRINETVLGLVSLH